MLHKAIPLLVAFSLVLAACGSAGQSGATTSDAQGQELFVSNCGECHGNDATGSDKAPTIIGHTIEKVKEQVRTPEGDMDAISPDKLSDSDLELIAQFVASLGAGEEAHEEITFSDEERTHLMAAYEAIKDKDNIDRETAVQHLEQADALATDEAAKLYEELIEAIEAKKAGTARHELKELLGLMDMK